MGMLADLISRQFGIKTRVRENPLTSSIGINAERVVPSNPNRLALTVINLSANTIYLGFDNRVSSINGIYVAPNGGGISLIYDEDFEMVGYEIWGIATGTNSSIKVIEVIGEGEVK